MSAPTAPPAKPASSREAFIAATASEHAALNTLANATAARKAAEQAFLADAASGIADPADAAAAQKKAMADVLAQIHAPKPAAASPGQAK